MIHNKKTDAEIVDEFENHRAINFYSIPPYHYNRLKVLNMLDDIHEGDLQHAAIMQVIHMVDRNGRILKEHLRPYIQKATLNSLEQAAHDRLYQEADKWLAIRNSFAVAYNGGDLPKEMQYLLEDAMQRGVVFLSKPIKTTIGADIVLS
jgi:hypothetical protein